MKIWKKFCPCPPGTGFAPPEKILATPMARGGLNGGVPERTNLVRQVGGGEVWLADRLKTQAIWGGKL